MYQHSGGHVEKRWKVCISLPAKDATLKPNKLPGKNYTMGHNKIKAQPI